MQRQDLWRKKVKEVFPDLREAEVERLVAGAVCERFARRSVIYSSGDVSEQLYLVLAGVVALSLISTGGRKLIVHLAGPGQLLGFSAFSPSRERLLRAEAFTDVEAMAVGREHFLGAFAHPEGRALLSSLFLESLWRLTLREVGVLALDIKARLVALLGELARDFGVCDARGTVIDLRLTHETLAMLAGASRQRVSVALGELRRSGILARDGRRLVLRRLPPEGELAALWAGAGRRRDRRAMFP